MLGLVAVAIALPPPSVNELRLEPDMFVTRLSLDLRVIHCEPKVSELLDYTPDELTNRSLYSLVHGKDVLQLRKAHLDCKNLFFILKNIVSNCKLFFFFSDTQGTSDDSLLSYYK